MIPKKEFYFIRHGQTDHNLKGIKTKVDHQDVPLNAVGLEQAHAIETVIANLPVKNVCFSPLQRAKQTKDIITTRLQVPQHEISQLGECTTKVWMDMSALGPKAFLTPPPHVQNFIQRTLEGINNSLSLEGPVLIVAHGGIHWALCCVLGITNHDWGIDNCIPVHFSLGEDGRWHAKKLIA